MTKRVLNTEKKYVNKKKFMILGIVLLVLVILYFLLNYREVDKRPNHPFFASDRPLVIAHQGGEKLAPSNTIEAFKNAIELGVDVLEMDIHITKDGELVTIHDPTVDRTTNSKGKVSEMNYSEIQRLDAGYYFKDLHGQYSFRDKGNYIPTLKEVFESFPNTRMIIEIKNDNPSERLDEVCLKLWRLIKQYNKEQQIVVASFSQDIIDQFQEVSEGKVALSSGIGEITKFVFLEKVLLSNLYEAKADTFQLPLEVGGISLTKPGLIKEMKRRNINVQYWTIDDEETMRYLLDNGADGIITNRPDVLIDVLNEMGY